MCSINTQKYMKSCAQNFQEPVNIWYQHLLYFVFEKNTYISEHLKRTLHMMK